MKWYLNMKIGKKIISGFVMVALISGLLGIFAIYNIQMLDASETDLYKNITVPLSEIGSISTAFQRTRVNMRDMISAQTDADIRANIDKLNERRSEIDKIAEAFEKAALSPATQKNYEALTAAEKTYRAETDKIIELAKENRDPEALALMAEEGPEGIASRTVQNILEKTVTQFVSDAKTKAASDAAKADSTATIMIVVIILVLLLSALIGAFISTLITRPLKKSVFMIDEMSKGHFGERLNQESKDEIGQMARSMDFFADELQMKVIGVMNSISSGDASMKITVKDEKDEIAPAMKKTIETINALNQEVHMLIGAVLEGKLDVKGNSDGYSGAWKDMIDGINGLVDAFVRPINVTAEYIERISKGDIPPRIEDVYQGDFNEIKNSLNGCIDVMNRLLGDTNKLIQATQEGKLDARGNSDAYTGDWNNLVKGINDLIDAFVSPINLTAMYVERISKGDIPDKITDTYYGDFNEIKNNINNCITVMNELLGETNSLISAAQKGQLDTRGNAGAFSGEWSTLVGGMNDLVDALVTPINVTSEYVDRISKGDIPDKITDTYYGDFNKIKNNLNNCIDIMNGLLGETNKLIYAAKEGQLSVRANISGFAGSWEELVGGVNELVEAVVKPINEVTLVMNEISQGNLNVSVKGDYQGEFKVLSNAVNNTASDLQAVIGEISMVIGSISEGNLAIEPIRAYQGDFINISNSLNTILESLNTVLGDINTASEQVSIGSKQVSDGSQALSQGSTEQASSVEELTASVTEVAVKTKENASNANVASELTLAVKESAEQGSQHMTEMLQAMEAISDSSHDISKIIKVIDDIAFQTNILALNAAVEAARAGQHGKGFAVVAEEVRALAAKSAEAAKDTTELIQGSIKKSSGGTAIANNTAQALTEIVEGIAKTAEIILEISRSSNEQAMGITQINTGLNQISQVVQNNAATAEESAASSEELSSQAELLREMVEKFRLRIKGFGVTEHKQLLRSSEDHADTKASPQIFLSQAEFDKY